MCGNTDEAKRRERVLDAADDEELLVSVSGPETCWVSAAGNAMREVSAADTEARLVGAVGAADDELLQKNAANAELRLVDFAEFNVADQAALCAQLLEEHAEQASYLAGLGTTRAVLDAYGLSTKKALGQNFLVSDGIIRKILSAADITPGERVVEIGPGIGTLTVGLLDAGAQVVSIERDHDLPRVLAATCDFAADRFRLISADALSVTPEEIAQVFGSGEGAQLAHARKLVANLPYAVAATLILDYFERFDEIEQMTVMVQSEVADRILARPGNKNYGAYTVKLSLFAEPVGRFQVSPGNFFPPPRVQSSVVTLKRVERPGVDAALLRMTALMADAAFATRRKTLMNSFRTYFAAQGRGGECIDDETLRDLFERADIDAARRGESLTMEEFFALGRSACGLGL